MLATSPEPTNRPQVSAASDITLDGRISPVVLVLGASILTLGLAVIQLSGEYWLSMFALLASLPLAVISPRARVLALTFGGLLVFQSSGGLSLLKSAYFVVALVALLAAARRVFGLSDRVVIALMRPMLVSTAIFAGVVALSLAVATAEGTPLFSWVRDAAPYFLFCTVPIFAIDFSTSLSRRYLISVLIVAGVVSALSWAIEWAGIERHNVFALPIKHLVLPSSLLSTAVLCFAASRAIISRGGERFLWIGLAVALVGVLALFTGTRSELLLLLVPLIVSLALPGRPVARTLRVLGLTFVALIVTLVVTLAALKVVGLNPNALVVRLANAVQLVSDPTKDFSFRQRQEQVDSAIKLFLSSPVVGVGPGHLFDWATAADGPVARTFNVDTGMALPAKFGLVGVGALAAFGVGLVVVLRKMAVTIRASASRAALVAFAVFGAISFLLGSTPEDKGFSFGLILLLALALADHQASILVNDSPPALPPPI